MGGHGIVVGRYVCLLIWLEILLGRSVLVGVGPGLHYRPFPGFHQKVRIRSPRGHVSFLVHVVVQNRTLPALASIALVVNLACTQP